MFLGWAPIYLILRFLHLSNESLCPYAVTPSYGTWAGTHHGSVPSLRIYISYCIEDEVRWKKVTFVADATTVRGNCIFARAKNGEIGETGHSGWMVVGFQHSPPLTRNQPPTSLQRAVFISKTSLFERTRIIFFWFSYFCLPSLTHFSYLLLTPKPTSLVI